VVWYILYSTEQIYHLKGHLCIKASGPAIPVIYEY